MTGHLTTDQMKALYEANLSEEETKCFEEHLSSCGECEAEYTQYLALIAKHGNKTEGRWENVMGGSKKNLLINCLICGNQSFDRRPAQLNTSTLSFFGLDWLNKTADCYVCKSCGYIHWFV